MKPYQHRLRRRELMQKAREARIRPDGCGFLDCLLHVRRAWYEHDQAMGRADAYDRYIARTHQHNALTRSVVGR